MTLNPDYILIWHDNEPLPVPKGFGFVELENGSETNEALITGLKPRIAGTESLARFAAKDLDRRDETDSATLDINVGSREAYPLGNPKRFTVANDVTPADIVRIVKGVLNPDTTSKE